MFHLLPKNLFFLPSRSSFSSSQVRRLLSRFHQIGEFSSSQSDWNCSRNIPVSVWWDMDNCGVPSGVSFLKVAPSIMAAVRANGIKGRIKICVYGDLPSSEVDCHALFLTDITLIGNSFGEKNNRAYKAIIRDLHFWVSANPPPAHLFLILGDRDDRDLSGILHQLRMKNYNILIACSSGRASDTLCSATTIMWQWSSMLKGENVTGKHFNYPPDAPFNSFYGLKMPLGNPFSATQEPTYSQNAKIQEPFSAIKGSEVPKSLYWQVKKILLSWLIGK